MQAVVTDLDGDGLADLAYSEGTVAEVFWARNVAR
jgi:hypothetical protein